MPAVYAKGCAEPVLKRGMKAVEIISATALAGGKCSRLQRATATWAQSYLNDLGKR